MPPVVHGCVAGIKLVAKSDDDECYLDDCWAAVAQIEHMPNNVMLSLGGDEETLVRSILTRQQARELGQALITAAAGVW